MSFQFVRDLLPKLWKPDDTYTGSFTEEKPTIHIQGGGNFELDYEPAHKMRGELIISYICLHCTPTYTTISRACTY